MRYNYNIAKILLLLLVLLAPFIAGAQLSGTYTIDPSKSASSTNYRTFQSAANDMYVGARTDGGAANGKGVSGKVTFKIANGIYVEQLQLISIQGISASNHVTFESASGNNADVILTWPSSTSSTGNFTVLVNTPYVTFQNLTIERSGTEANGRAIQISGNLTSVNFYDNRIRTSYTNASQDAILISLTQSSFIDIKNNHFFYGGLNLQFLSATTGLLIEGNTFIAPYESAIYVSNADAPRITGNTIQDVRSTSTNATGIKVSKSVNEIKVLGNKVYMSKGKGLVLDLIAPTNTDRALVANNMISIRKGAKTDAGIYLYRVQYTDVAYNSVAIHSEGSALLAESSSGYVGNKLLNNIFFNSNGGYTMNASVNNDFLIYANYNDYYAATSVRNIMWSGTNYQYVADFNSATGYGSNSLSTHPFFVDSFDLHITQAALDGRGVPFADVTSDIEGDARSPIDPDIGADEIVFYKNDVAVKAILSPQDQGCGNAATPVRVIIVNNGTDPQDDIIVKAEITGGITQTLTHTYTKFLQYKKQDTVTFATTLNTGTGMQLYVKAYTAHIGDGNLKNDTIQRGMEIVSKPTAPTVTGGEACRFEPVLLKASAAPGMILNWYDSLNAITPLYTGSNYTAPSLDFTKNYYVATTRETPYKLKPEFPWAGYHYENKYENTLTLVVKEKIVIDSVSVFPSASGDVIFRILDENGTFISGVKRAVSVPGAGYMVPIKIDLALDPGTYLIDAVGTDVPGLASNNASAYYPYEAQGIAAITSASRVGSYYFFYNWRIKTEGCEGDRVPVLAKVSDKVKASFEAIDSACAGVPVQFTNTSFPDSGLIFYWNFGDQSGSASEHPVRAFPGGGTYIVTLYVVEPNSCTDTFAKAIEILPFPEIDFEINNTCIGQQTEFINKTTGAVQSVKWDFGDGKTSVSTNGSNIYADKGTYYVKLVATSPAGCKDSFIKEVVIAEPPTVGFSYLDSNMTYYFTPDDTNLTSYLWEFGDGNFSNDMQPVHTYLAPADYTVKLYAERNGCEGQHSEPITVTGIEEKQAGLTRLNIFPNPFTDKTTIAYTLPSSARVSISLFDMTGRTIANLYDGLTPAGDRQVLINKSKYGMMAGVYLLRITTGSSTITRQLILAD